MTGPYTDHHVHLLSTVAARLSVDVSAAGSLEELSGIVRGSPAAAGRGWVRAWGYEEWALAERRHPTREDLDRMMAGRPLVMHHRSGHAAVVNSVGLTDLGEPDHPDGVLFDRHDLLSRVPRLAPEALERAAAAVSREWESAGVAAIVDATHTTGPAELEVLSSWCAKGVLRQRVTAMVGAPHVRSVPRFGASVGAVTVGPMKVMPGPGAGRDIPALVDLARGAGFPVAVHVVDVDVLESTLDALGRSSPPPGATDRIEHNALCLPEQVGRIAACGATVVVNPGFLVHRRRKYESELTAVERRWLIRIGSLLRAGVAVRAGSDSPVTPSCPADVIAGATAHPFAPEEAVGRAQAEALLAD